MSDKSGTVPVVMPRPTALTVTAASLLLTASALAAEDAGLGKDIQELYGSEETVSLATGYTQSLTDAPAVATVITRHDIERLGATTLAEVLETVPGLHVSTARGLSDLFVIRGFLREFNSQLLLMINGLPVNDVVNGGRPQGWAMPVHNIARIEVIRGPGSALYGADALAGVINVITKSADDIKTPEVGLYGGSFDTVGGWLLTRGQWGSVKGALSLSARTTDGYRETVRADDQTRIDTILGTRASLAPGPTNTDRDDVDVRLDLQGERWRFRAGYQGFLDVGTGAGTTLVLDPDGDFSTELFSADFTYTLSTSRHWEVEAQFSYLATTSEVDVYPLPPGTLGGLFPAGLRSQFRFRVDQGRGGFTALFDGFQAHRLRLGAGLHYAAVNEVTDRANFIIDAQGNPLPLEGLTDVRESGAEPVVPEEQRTVAYAFVQDEWRFAPDWTLTAGARLDHYSDFGTTFNPRLSLVWNVSPTLTAKFLYGSAFRAPSFTELYVNSGAIQGDPDLDPETIDTVEVALSKRWHRDLWTGLTLFWYGTDDRILSTRDLMPVVEAGRVINAAGARGYGLELEADYRLSDALSLKAHYAWQDAEDTRSRKRIGLAPEHQLYGELNWQLNPAWALNIRSKWVGERLREPGDPRAALESYTWTDLTLQRFDPQGQWDASLSVNNLFNEEAREPSVLPASLPDDIPLAGRHLIAQIRWRF